MAKPEQVGSLQIAQDLPFQQREWRIQRVAWVVVLLILIVGFAGLLGGGPLGQERAVSRPLALEYPRFVRERSPASLEIEVSSGTAIDGEILLWLNRAFLNKVDVERIMPEPTAMEAGNDHVIYRFAVAASDQPATITIDIQPHEPGMAQGRLGLVDGADVAFTRMIYP